MDQEALNDVDQWANGGREIGDKRRVFAGIGHAGVAGPPTGIVRRILIPRHLSLTGTISTVSRTSSSSL